MNLKPRKSPRGITWLALSLALGYFSLMATVMWLFESSITLDDVAEVLADPQRRKYWAVIAVTAVGVFAIAYWALARISQPSARPARPPALVGLAEDDRDTRQYARRSWTAAALLLVALGAILLGTGSYVLREQEVALDAARHRHFALIGKTKVASVTRWIGERERDLQVLLANPSFVDDLNRWLVKSDNGKLHESIVADMQAVLRANNFDSMVVVTRAGKVAIDLPENLQARRLCLQTAMAPPDAQAKSITESLAFNNASGQPTLDVIGKAYALDGVDKHHVATLCMRVDLTQRLLPMVSRWPGVAESGEVLLGRESFPNEV